MKLPFWPQRKGDYTLEVLEERDSRALSLLQREDFSRPWTDGEFAALLSQGTVFGFVARRTGHGAEDPVGFVLARLVAGEAEILMLAVARAHRRQGLGWLLMDAVLRHLHRERAEALFLEVDETNVAALALYRGLGFVQVGRRPRYYPKDDGASGALVMRRQLRAPAGGPP